MFAPKEVVFRTVTVREEVDQILELQNNNLESAIAPDLVTAEGFVTVKHEPDVLWRINQKYPAIIAKNGDRVVGYTLIMSRDFAVEIPILIPMFELLETLKWRNIPLKESSRWFVMGQVCIDKDYRGLGVFDGMYQKMREVCSGQFDFTVTEVAERNIRSIRAHERVGFQTLYQYTDNLSDELWRIIVMDF